MQCILISHCNSILYDGREGPSLLCAEFGNATERCAMRWAIRWSDANHTSMLIAQSHRAPLHCILHRIAPSHRASLRRVAKFSTQQRWPFSVVLLYFWVQKRPPVTLISGSTRTTAILPDTDAVIVFSIAD